MSLLLNKLSCPICGGQISWLLPWKIDGEITCDTCYSKIDMEIEKKNNLTMQDVKEYLAFYDQNQLQKDRFVVSERIDYGLWDTNIIFDYRNKLFCMSKQPDKTVFEGRQLKAFTIKEDNMLLFEGSADGIKRYFSKVPERAIALTPQIIHFMMKKHISHARDKMMNNGTSEIQNLNVPEPFHAFNVELHFDHPYWTIIKFGMEGPKFSNERPNVNDYTRSYQQCIKEIEKLVSALKTVAFPDEPVQFNDFDVLEIQAVHTTMISLPM